MSIAKSADRLAFDRASVRAYDQDGKLHVAVTPISKATVNPYMGSEIPNWESLGLDAQRIYMLLRHPDELAKGAPTFNNVPILSEHVPFNVVDFDKELIVGSTGTDAAFASPYLTNSLVVWDIDAIQGIESDEKRELSCSYRYTAVMQPGEYEGQKYDGVMTDIVGNHVALVEVGRAGPDVVVNDSNPFLEHFDMSKTSRLAIAVRGALRGHIKPLLATDAAMPDLTKLVGLPTTKTLDKDASRIVKAVEVELKGKLAADAKVDGAALLGLIKIAADSEPDEEMGEDEDDEQREDESDEDYEKRTGKKGKKNGGDNPPDFKDKPADPEKAMDARIKAAAEKAGADARAQARKDFTALRQAETDVEPLVGEVAAMDSAEDVYRYALEKSGVDLADVHPSAFRAMVKQQVLAQDGAPKKKDLANDAAAGKGLSSVFSNLKKPGRA